MTAVCVGERVDWIAVGFRVALDDSVMKRVEAAARIADGHGRSEIALSNDSFRWEPHVRSVTKSRRLLTSDNQDVRVIVDPKAPAGVDENGEPIETDGELPRWTVGIEISGETLIRVGWERSLAAAHEVAGLFGRSYGARLRRLDLCADFVGFPLRREDAKNLVTLARSRKLHFSREGEGQKEGQWIEHELSGELRTVSLAPGAFFSARLYDKTYELECRRDKDKTRAEVESWSRRALEASEHARGLMLQAGPEVTRVEFQVRGQVLREMGLRSAKVEDVALALDRIWRYATTERVERGRKTHGWVRLVEPLEGQRLTRRPIDARWLAVQAVRFKKDKPELVKRVRSSTGARSAQVFGCAVSLLAASRELPRVPVITGDGEIVQDVEAMLARVAQMPEEEARKTVSLAVEAILRRSARIVAEDFLAERRPRQALEHLFVGWGATLAKVRPVISKQEKRSA